MAPLSSSPTSTTPDCKTTGKAGNVRKDTGRDAAPYHDNSQAPEVFTLDNDSAPNHRPVNKPVGTEPRPEAHKVTRPSRNINGKDTEHLHNNAAKMSSNQATDATRDDKIVIIRIFQGILRYSRKFPGYSRVFKGILGYSSVLQGITGFPGYSRVHPKRARYIASSQEAPSSTQDVAVPPSAAARAKPIIYPRYNSNAPVVKHFQTPLPYCSVTVLF